jgi:hypothetical protein
MNKILINILTPFKFETFTRQFLNNEIAQNFEFYENSNLDLLWDIIIVYEGINQVEYFKCKSGGLIFISGEPPLSRKYSSFFLNQFDHLITSHKQIKHKNNHLTQQSLPWHYGFSYLNNMYNFDINDLLNLKPFDKIKKLSIISSNKQMMPGHTLRHSFVNFLKKEYSNEIDFFGKGNHFIDDKAEGLIPYFFSICIENSSIKDYWTEKLADPILAYSIPVYYGCTNIDKYFDSNGIISLDIKNKKSAVSIIDNILNNTSKIYDEKINSLIINRNSILFKHNLQNSIIRFYIQYINNKHNKLIPIFLKPSYMFWDHNFKNNLLRVKRLVHNITNIN